MVIGRSRSRCLSTMAMPKQMPKPKQMRNARCLSPDDNAWAEFQRDNRQCVNDKLKYRQARVPDAQCSRDGCKHNHRESPRDHGYCCNACRKNQTWHTTNCTGHNQALVRRTFDLTTPPGTPDPAEDEESDDQCWGAWTDNAKARLLQSKQKWQAQDIALGACVPKLSVPGRHRIPWQAMQWCGQAFRLPAHWRRGKASVVSFCSWYMTEYSIIAHPGVMPTLRTLDFMLKFVSPDRQICLHAFAADNLPDWLEDAHINLHELGVNGRSPSYQMHAVTGLNFPVQANLLSQSVLVQALLDACNMIEDSNLSDFAFVCRGGTHRSVGGILLLAMLLYPNAKLVMHTKRTARAAESHCSKYSE